jgi:hypothetical protein
MSAPYSQFVDNTNHGEEAVTTAVRTWGDTVQSFAGNLTSGQSPLPALQGVVEQYFDLAEKVLANQREFAQQWASATGQAFGVVTEQAHRATQSVAAHTANGAEAVVDHTAETARAAGNDALATSLVVRDA